MTSVSAAQTAQQESVQFETEIHGVTVGWNTYRDHTHSDPWSPMETYPDVRWAKVTDAEEFEAFFGEDQWGPFLAGEGQWAWDRFEDQLTATAREEV